MYVKLNYCTCDKRASRAGRFRAGRRRWLVVCDNTVRIVTIFLLCHCNMSQYQNDDLLMQE